jgi:5-methylcytosine-specific restriction endonuclease McrA
MTTTERKRSRNSHQPVGRWIRPEKRLAIYLRDKFACTYCGRDLHNAPAGDVHLDHVVAKSDGGTNHETNLVTACRTCNCSRQSKNVADFAPKALGRLARQTATPLASFVASAKAIISDRSL